MSMMKNFHNMRTYVLSRMIKSSKVGAKNQSESQIRSQYDKNQNKIRQFHHLQAGMKARSLNDLMCQSMCRTQF